MESPPRLNADKVLAFLRGHSPGQFCGACLALRLGSSLIQTRELLMLLVGTGEILLRTGTCQSCTRTTEVFGLARDMLS